MNIKEEIKKFKPKLTYDDLRDVARSRDDFLQNDTLYSLVQQLTSLAVPSFKNEDDTKWNDFYLPVGNPRRIISVPFSVQEYDNNYSVWIAPRGSFDVRPGNAAIFEEATLFLEEALRLAPLMRDRELIKKTVPYNLRTGKIKRKHFMGEVMPQEERDRVWQSYQEHAKKNLKVTEISLSDYLAVAAICYRAVKDTEGKTPLEMYRRWSDRRFKGMLGIEDPDSKEEFMAWNLAETHNHPFEILKDSIHLYPPDRHSHWYRLTAVYDSSNERLIDLIHLFIKKEIPFEVNFLDETLDYMTGEEIVEVNTGLASFDYYPSRENYRLYFHHIKWDDLKFLEWK